MFKNTLESKTLSVTSLHSDGNPSPLRRQRAAMKVCLAAAVLIITLAPAASAQYIYVANAGEDTVSKIDINTNTEVARYATWFTIGSANYFPQPHSSGAGPAPSRLLQDAAGNLYVLNRWFGNSHRPVLVKIAPTGGTPGVTTSNSSTIRPMLDVGTTNDEIDAGDTKDARIVWGQPIGPVGGLGRSLCMDTTGVLWVGMWSSMQYFRVDATTGLVLAPTAGISTAPHRPYGCQVDTQGRLWSTDAANTLLEIDTGTNLLKPILNHGNNPGPPPTNFGTSYSLSLFNGCGSAQSKVYLSERGVSNGVSKTYIAYDPATGQFSNPLLPVPQFVSLAVGVGLDGNIVSGENATGRVIKTTPGGLVIWDTSVGIAGPTVPTTDLHGIIIDQNNDVWAVHLPLNQIVKYSGLTGQKIAVVPVGLSPYTYGNPPPPSCPCAAILEPRISCDKLSNGVGTYPFSFTFTNNSPFSTPATALSITSTQATNITPSPFVFTNPVPVNGQATVSGTFQVNNPVPGNQVCLDLKLNAGEGWCCPTQRVCFVLPSCPGCADVKAVFKCQNGKQVLQLQVTNQGPTPAQGMTVFSNTPGVTVSPQTFTQTFPQNTQVPVALNVIGAAPGQPISLTVSLNGPMDPKTGVYDWCCSTTVTVNYPKTFCATQVDGEVFTDLNHNGLRDSLEEPLSGWTVSLTDARGTSRTTKTEANGKYHFENVEAGTYRLTVPPYPGWRATAPEGSVYSVTAGAGSERQYDFGFAKAP
jgi:hypothetical protein